MTIPAEHYSHDLERYRAEMRDARQQRESLRVALREADDENCEMKRSMDQLLTDFERANVAGANDNSQLLEQLACERAKVEELTARLRRLSEAGSANVAPTRHSHDEGFRTFRDQVYVTVFANHDGYASMEQLQADLREDHGIDGKEVAQNYGFVSLADFLCSREMAWRISTENGPDGVVYKGIPNETNAHLREAHQISSENRDAQNAKFRRNLKAEERKVTNLRQEIKALHEQRRCQICMDRASDTTFLCGQKNGPKDACGHVVCGYCAENWRRQGKGCHLCRGEPIFKCVKLFLTGTQ
ncbi:Baculoviral IAP repeat-containing protein 7 [Aphelenchoides avenae]|nr:Baculoviral IAP repeat-containing protein 7 [Aphelenchus avenae]